MHLCLAFKAGWQGHVQCAGVSFWKSEEIAWTQLCTLQASYCVWTHVWSTEAHQEIEDSKPSQTAKKRKVFFPLYIGGTNF